MSDALLRKQRQVAYWRLIAATYGLGAVGASFDAMAGELADELGLPSEILDNSLSIEVLLHRYPKLKPHFEALQMCEQPHATDGKEVADVAAENGDDGIDLSKTLAYSKLLLNVFGPNTHGAQCSAAQYSQWCDDVGALEQCFGYGPGDLRQGSGMAPGEVTSGSGGGISGGTPRADDRQLREELVAMESDLIKRMELREVLKDDRLAARLTPTMPLVEQLLYDKSNLTGAALKNARRLIKKYVDDLAAVLKKEVTSASSGEIDRSVPPKRIFRNLDLKRTVWKNLPNFNPGDRRLYVDQLFYRHTAQKTLNKYLIVVVDQSGSMVDAMVQCAILASIFATLPRVQVSLLAFDTNVIDLTQWVHDPFESLMRTNLGGGNDGPKAMEAARTHILDPRRTTMVWISDFYEFENDRPLFNMIKNVKESGVHFIPVGSVSGKGYFSVNEWFRKQLKNIGLPVLTGNIKKLIVELKKQLN
jgi:Mg-chelatase subunit ChlD